MRRLTAEDFLALLEIGAGLHPIDRALHVLARAAPERDPEDLARLPLGSRDSLLLAVRRAALGARLDAQDVCPTCGERVELQLSCGALSSAARDGPAEWTLDHGGYRLRLRPLDSLDAAAAAQCTSVANGRAILLERAVTTAERDGGTIAVEDLPDGVAAAVASSILSNDAGAEIALEFTCPACRHRWRNVLDVVAFLWTEIVAGAQRLLADVHSLASTYGWREVDILQMSDARREAYLAMVNA
jgi:hypothetical protein